MSENRSTKSVFLISLMMASLLAPILSSPAGAEEVSNEHESDMDTGIIIGDLSLIHI